MRRSDIGNAFSVCGVIIVCHHPMPHSVFRLEENVRVVARRGDHLGNRIEPDRVEEVRHPDALDQFSDTLAVLAVLVPELPNAARPVP